MCDTMNLWLDTVPDQVADMVRKVDVALMNDAELSFERRIVRVDTDRERNFQQYLAFMPVDELQAARFTERRTRVHGGKYRSV